MPAPYRDDVAQLITAAHRQLVRAFASGGPLGVAELAVEQLDITWDEERAPRVTARLVTPALPGVLEMLDPRAGARVTLEAGYVHHGGAEDVQQVADLGVRKVSVRRPNNQLEVELAGDEALVVDASPTVNAESTTGASTSAAITALLRRSLSPWPVIVSSVTGSSATVDPVTDRWAAIADLADQANARVYDDGLRTWHIEPVPYLTSTPTHALTVGDGGTIAESEDATDRGSWFNYVILRYRWRNSSGADQVIQASAYINTGPYAITGKAGRRIFLDERTVATTQAAANNAAFAVLARMLTRGTTQSLSAVAAWWVRPGDTVTVTTPDTPPTDRLVSRVTFSAPSYRMQLETRLPDRDAVAAITVVETSTPVAAPVKTDPAPPSLQRYVTTWVASDSATYRGTGVKRTDLVGQIGQGQYGSTNGNQRSVVVFTAANSTGGETGKTVTQALAGVPRSQVEKVELGAWADHWYGSQGGYGRIGWANLTSCPGSYTGGSPLWTTSLWGRDSWRWITITDPVMIDAILAGTCRAVTFGPGRDISDYGLLASHAAGDTTHRPRWRITYAK